MGRDDRSAAPLVNWFYRSTGRYDTRGASCRLSSSGWVILWDEAGRLRARGPFAGGLDAAMDAWPAIRAAMPNSGDNHALEEGQQAAEGRAPARPAE